MKNKKYLEEEKGLGKPKKNPKTGWLSISGNL